MRTRAPRRDAADARRPGRASCRRTCWSSPTRSAPTAVAGVMGGADSEVTGATTTIVFESAYFNPLSVRRTSKKLGLKTEASMRFERGADPQPAGAARWSARCALLETDRRRDARAAPSSTGIRAPSRADASAAAPREDRRPARRRRFPTRTSARILDEPRLRRCADADGRLGRDRADAARGRRSARSI